MNTSVKKKKKKVRNIPQIHSHTPYIQFNKIGLKGLDDTKCSLYPCLSFKVIPLNEYDATTFQEMIAFLSEVIEFY